MIRAPEVSEFISETTARQSSHADEGLNARRLDIYNLVSQVARPQRYRGTRINATASIREAKNTVAAMLQRSNFSLAPQFA